MSDATKPVAKIGFPVTASIWRNERDGRVFYSTTFTLSYQDAEGKWKRSTNFGPEDLLPLAKIVDMAHTKVTELRTAERGSRLADHDTSSDE